MGPGLAATDSHVSNRPDAGVAPEGTGPPAVEAIAAVQSSPSSASVKSETSAITTPAPGSATQAEEAGLRESDRWLLFGGTVILVVLVLAHAVRLRGWGLQPIDIIRPQGHEYHFVLDINEATWVEWMQFDRIGETLARRIVANREQLGPFSNVNDLQRIPGIGPKTLEHLRPFLRVNITQVRQLPESGGAYE